VSAGSTIEITLEESYRGSAYALVELVMTSFSSLFLFYDDDTSESISKDGSYRIATFLINGIDNTDIQDTYLTDTFRWTDDGGSSWTSGGDINISSPYSLSGYNIEIIFTQQDEHALGDYWEFSQGNMKGMSVRDSLGNEYFQLTNGTLFATSLVGQIAAYATSTVPDGWLECNGAAISRSAYSELFNAIGTTFGAGNGSTTFNIPDLRGEFIRGWDHSRGVDSGRSFGSYQPDTLQGHRHYSGYGTNNRNGRFGATSDGIRSHLDADWSYADNYTNGANTSTPVTDSTHGTPRIDSETKPRNRALMYCIKY
jgi:microcystin-dependent protein